jgi:hypothetical protein
MADDSGFEKVGEVITTTQELLQVGINQVDQAIVLRCFAESEAADADDKNPPTQWMLNLGAYDALILGQILLEAADSNPAATLSPPDDRWPLLDAVLQAARRLDLVVHAGTVTTELARLSEELAQAATAWNQQIADPQ